MPRRRNYQLAEYIYAILQNYDPVYGPEIEKIMQTQQELKDAVKEPVGLGTDPFKTILPGTN